MCRSSGAAAGSRQRPAGSPRLPDRGLPTRKRTPPMGRMLQTLRNGEQMRAAHAGPAGECVVDWSLPESTEVPFIEVGGPKKIDGSHQVLAGRQESGDRSPETGVREKETATGVQALGQGGAVGVVAKIVDMAAVRPMGVAFEAWPAARRTARQPAAEIIAYHQPEHTISLQYLARLDPITQSLRDGHSVVLLAGVRGLVGTSTVLLNLAVASARRRNKRVIIWEASLGKTALAARLGLAASLGVSDVVS